MVQFRRSHEEPLLLVFLATVVVMEEGGAGAVHPQVSVDVAVAGRGRREGGPAAQGPGLAHQGLGLAAHAAGPAADAAERDRPDDQRELQLQLLTARDVQRDLREEGAGLNVSPDSGYIISSENVSNTLIDFSGTRARI